MRSDGSLRDQKPPRALILATGEDVPRGQSIRARALILEVSGGDIGKKRLTECQRAAASGLYAQCMAAFISFIAADYEGVQKRLRERATVLRARAAGHTRHARTPGIVADLQAGFEQFLDFAVNAGAISAERRADLESRSWAALLEAGQAQSKHQESVEPARRYLQLVAAAISSGRAHVANRDGGTPERAERWGWRRESDKWAGKGERVGWIDGDDLYLEPDASFAVAQTLARDSGESLAITGTTLHKRLSEQAFLVSKDETRGTLKIRRSLQGVQRAVLHLRADAVEDVGFFSRDVGSMSDSDEKTDSDLVFVSSESAASVGNVGFPSGRDGSQEDIGAELEVIEL